MAMKTNRYFLVIIFRVVMITLTSFVLVWFFTETNRPATSLFFLIALIFQTISLIRYLNHVNRDLANFLIYLQENDTSLVFSRNRVEKNFKNVMAGLNEINKKIQDARRAKEEKHQYLQAVVEHLETGILSYNSRGEIEIVNHIAFRLLGIKPVKTIDSLIAVIPELQEAFRQDFSDGVVKLHSEGRNVELVLKSKELKIAGEPIRIYSIQNITQELETRELESWKKLIRVLRHEIMNSITPITTLSTAIKRSFTRNGQLKTSDQIEVSNIKDAVAGAEVIEERSKGLVSFVEQFRNITDLPRPVLKTFSVAEMLAKIQVLFRNVLQENEIELCIDIEPELYLHADQGMLEQVMINLVKNSVESIGRDGQISIRAFAGESQKRCIQVIDNGTGIHADDLENIFVPSFTTKEHGMGLGLSVSKQIIQLHKGEITVNSTKESTVFEIWM